MSKAHRLKTRKALAKRSGAPINFLIGCSETALDNYQLSQLGRVADLRKEMHAILDQLIEANGLAWLAAWFQTMDRAALKRAIENEEPPLEQAKREIRDGQRSEEELLPLPSLLPGAAHLAAALRYQERNMEEGKCAVCPEPLDGNSVRFCTKHLAASRTKSARERGVKGAPGSADYLYGEISESTQ